VNRATTGRSGEGSSAPPTIYEVARQAGVSISTVSLALNSPGRVRAATRHRVLTAADALGYVPKSEAIARARRSLGRIGVIAPFTTYSSFATRLNGVFDAVADKAVDVVAFDEPSAASADSPLLATLPVTGRIDGLIVMDLPLTDAVTTRLLKSKLPTVLIDETHPAFDSVKTDDYAGGRLAAEHLLGRGRTKFAFLGEVQAQHEYALPSRRRLRGYADGLTRAGQVLAEPWTATAENSLAAATEVATRLLDAPERPDAILAHTDLLAAGVLKAAAHLGLSVPGDVSVVGYDDGDLAEALGLTTVRQPFHESGRIAAQMLLDRLSGRHQDTRSVELRLELVRRQST
jgi:DNA-binding LacI/PurR family transcriptional regulator